MRSTNVVLLAAAFGVSVGPKVRLATFGVSKHRLRGIVWAAWAKFSHEELREMLPLDDPALG